jgi:hypothetical protein
MTTGAHDRRRRRTTALRSTDAIPATSDGAAIANATIKNEDDNSGDNRGGGEKEEVAAR